MTDESKHSEALDKLKSPGGQDTVDPLAGTSLIFNLRQTERALHGFHPKHSRTIPKAHFPSNGTGEELSLVPAGIGAETYLQMSAQVAETRETGETFPFWAVPQEQDEEQDSFSTQEPQESTPAPRSAVLNPQSSAQNSLEKPPGGSHDTGLPLWSGDKSGGPLPLLTPGATFGKGFPIGREFDPFSSHGFILPPSSSPPESASVIPPLPEDEEPEKNRIKPGESPDPDGDSDVDSDVSKQVRMQYEKLPYPFRDPEEDKKRLTMPLIDNLMVVNQRCFQGKKDFHGQFRMLVAGGGTGDASTYLAVQTAWLPNAKVVYVDLSTESMKIARERLHNQAVRLKHPNIEKVVEFHHGSLLDVEKMGLGKFDYINCSGVLHHLKDPNEGLTALRSVLKEDGAMSIMVYGQVGRTTIYQIQELMRIVNRNVDDMDEKINNTNLFLRYLPSGNLHRLGGRWGANESNPVEIYDLFLHSQDRAYTIDQLYDWVEGCGMSITAFSPGQHSFLSPELYPQALSHKIRTRIKGMSVREQRVFSELFYGHINKFEFHITPQPGPGIDWFDLDLIPGFSLLAKQQNMPARLSGTEESASLFHIPNHLDKLSFTIRTSPFGKSVYQNIDDLSTVGEILQKMRSLYPQLSDEAIHRDTLKNLKQLAQFDIIHLRHKSCRCELLNRSHF